MKLINEDHYVYIFWGVIILIGGYYFLSENKKMNDDYGCNFDIFFPNWEEHQKKLLSKKARLSKEATDPEKITFSHRLQQDIEDAKKDLQKREYLKEADIREAERLVQLEEKLQQGHIESNKKRQANVNKCLDYIQKKSPNNYGIGNIELCEIPGLKLNFIDRFTNYQTDLIQDVMELTSDYSSFTYDLNNDGYDEVFVSDQRQGFCGSGGCKSYVIDGRQKKVIFETFSNISLIDKYHNGYQTILEYGRNYQGKKYECNYSMSECNFNGLNYECN